MFFWTGLGRALVCASEASFIGLTTMVVAKPLRMILEKE